MIWMRSANIEALITGLRRVWAQPLATVAFGLEILAMVEMLCGAGNKYIAGPLAIPEAFVMPT